MLSLPLPRAIELVAQKLPMQCSVIDPAAGVGNPMIAMSNGVELVFGLR